MGRFPCNFSNFVAPTMVLVLTKDKPWPKGCYLVATAILLLEYTISTSSGPITTTREQTCPCWVSYLAVIVVESSWVNIFGGTGIFMLDA